MIGALLLLLVVVALVAAAVSAFARRSRAPHPAAVPGRPEADAHAVREIFQHLLLLGLLVVTAVGVAGLLGAALAQGTTLVVSDTAIARSVAFTVVGAPLLAGLAWWTRRAQAADPTERLGVGWLLYLAAAELVALLVALTSLHGVLAWLVGLRTYDASTLADALVWTAVWAGHALLSRRQPDQRLMEPQRLAGSLVGLAFGLIGLGVLVTGALSVWFGLDGGAVVAGHHDPILEGAVTLALGAVTWWIYWWRVVRRAERRPLWLAYVLLVGVAAGTIVALVSGSIALYRVAVWLVGDPWTHVATRYFDAMPAALAAAFVGLVSLAYHRSLLAAGPHRERTDIDRVRDYLLAAIGLGGSVAGATIVVVALVEALTNPTVLTGGGPLNTLLAALTLLVVGVPVWWLSWRRGQRAADGGRGRAETTSVVRRLYLFLLLGVASLMAVGALLAVAWLLVEGLLQGDTGSEVVRSVRLPLGLLLTTAAVAAYHWRVHLRTREHDAAHPPAPRGPRFVVLLGVGDAATAATIAHRTGAMTWAWSRLDDERRWPVDDLLATLGGLDPVATPEVMLMAEGDSLRVVPMDRRPPLPRS